MGNLYQTRYRANIESVSAVTIVRHMYLAQKTVLPGTP